MLGLPTGGPAQSMKTRSIRPSWDERRRLFTASGDGRSQIGRRRTARQDGVVARRRHGSRKGARFGNGRHARRHRRYDGAHGHHAAFRQSAVSVAGPARRTIVHQHGGGHLRRGGGHFRAAMVMAFRRKRSARSRGQQTDESQDRAYETEPVRHQSFHDTATSLIENEAVVMPDVFGDIGRGLISSRAAVALRSLNAAEKESRPSQGGRSQGGIAQEGHGAETPQ